MSLADELIERILRERGREWAYQQGYRSLWEKYVERPVPPKPEKDVPSDDR